MADDEPEPHVDPDELASTVALIMAASSESIEELDLVLRSAHTLLDHLHTAPYKSKQRLGSLDCHPSCCE